MKQLKKKSIHHRGAEAQRNTMFYFLAPAAQQNNKPLRLCASAVNRF